MALPAKAYADVQVVQPQGRIDHNSSNDFQTGLVDAVESADDYVAVVLDLSGVEVDLVAHLNPLMTLHKEYPVISAELTLSYRF